MNGNNANAPTEKQLNAIRKLARRTRSSVNLNRITSKQEVSRILDELIARSNGRGKKAAHGMAVKLVFQRYQQLSTNYRTEGFWKEVDDFYKQYLEHMDRALKLGSSQR